MSNQQRRLQLTSRVPGVISGPNSQEEQRLRLSLAQLEQQRLSQGASDAAWLRSFAIRQTVHLQSLHRLGYTGSLDILPDCLLTDYGDSLMGVAKQPLLGRIAALSQQQKRLRREREGIRRSVSLGDSGGSDLFTRTTIPDAEGGISVSESRFSSSRGSDNQFLSLSSSISSQTIKSGELPPAIRANLAVQPIRSDPAPQPIRSDQAPQPIRNNQAAHPTRGDRVTQPIRRDRVTQPIRGDQATQPIRSPLRLPQLDPRFLGLVNSLERKSAWKRSYQPPQVLPSGGQPGNSLEELVNSYYSK